MLRPWDTIDSEELRLLRFLENTVASQGGVSPEVHAILGQLGELRKKLNPNSSRG